MAEQKKCPFEEALDSLPKEWGELLRFLPKSLKEQATEIRFRTGRPICICTGIKNYYVTSLSTATEILDNRCLSITKQEMEKLVLHLCGYSLHSHQEDMANGFLTVKGGHRAGLSGSAVVQNGRLSSVKQISSVNLRIAREVKGCAQDFIRRVYADGPQNVLVAGSPASGKTTLIRDAVRLLAKAYQVAVVDERGEIAASISGLPQNDVGPFTDILDGYPKAQGILSAIRSLSPDFIVCDEIGSDPDLAAVKTGTNSGIHILATIHAANLDELVQKPFVRELVLSGAIDQIVFLKSRQMPGKIEKIIKVGDSYAQMDGKHLDYRLVHGVRPDPVGLAAKTCPGLTDRSFADR